MTAINEDGPHADVLRWAETVFGPPLEGRAEDCRLGFLAKGIRLANARGCALEELEIVVGTAEQVQDRADVRVGSVGSQRRGLVAPKE